MQTNFIGVRSSSLNAECKAVTEKIGKGIGADQAFFLPLTQAIFCTGQIKSTLLTCLVFMLARVHFVK